MKKLPRIDPEAYPIEQPKKKGRFRGWFAGLKLNSRKNKILGFRIGKKWRF